MTRRFSNLIGGQAVEQPIDLSFAQLQQPGGCDRRVSRGHRGAGAPGLRGGPQRVRRLARHARPGARRDHRLDRQGDRARERSPEPAGQPRDGQDPERSARRCSGGDRHLPLLPVRGPAAVRPDRAVGDAAQGANDLSPAARRGWDHHRRQFPDRGAQLEDHPGAGDRQHNRLEAVRGLPSIVVRLRQADRGGRAARRGAECGVRRRARRGRRVSCGA